MMMTPFPTRAALAALLSLFCIACTTPPPSTESTEPQASTQKDGLPFQYCSFQVYEAATSGAAFVYGAP